MNQFEIAAICIIVPLIFFFGYALGNAKGHKEHVQFFEEEEKKKDEDKRNL